eukprot:scaffold15.g4343.t1
MLLEDAETAYTVLLQAIAAIQRLQQNLEAANALNAERLAAYDANERLLSAFGVGVPDDAREQVDALIARGLDGQKEVLLLVEEVTRLERQRRLCADPFPSAELPQGWGHRLCRIVCFLAATAIIDVASAIGFPVYLGWLRRCLAVCQAIVLISLVMLILGWHKMNAWHAVGVVGLIVLILRVYAYYTSNFWDKDVKARQDGVSALKTLLTEAADLRARLQQHLPDGVARSLRAALEACLDRCAATLERDEQRLRQLKCQTRSWQQRPLRTLVRSAVMLAGCLKAFFS